MLRPYKPPETRNSKLETRNKLKIRNTKYEKGNASHGRVSERLRGRSMLRPYKPLDFLEDRPAPVSGHGTSSVDQGVDHLRREWGKAFRRGRPQGVQARP